MTHATLDTGGLPFSPEPLEDLLHSGPEPDWTTRIVVGLALWLLSLTFAAVGLRWLRAHSLHLVERGAEEQRALDLRRQQAEDDDAQALTYAVNRVAPMSLTAIDDAATILGRITEIDHGVDLDIDATLDATVRAAGRFVPHLAPSRRQHHITVLVDIETGSHPYLHALLFVLARWHQLGVKIERYDFKHRPRFVEPRPTDGDNEQLRTERTRRLSLDQLARRSEGSPLLIATRMADLAEKNGAMPWLRHLGAWPMRVVLDLDPRSLAARDGETRRVADRLSEAGVLRFPFTPAGLNALAMYLAHGAGPPPPEPSLPSWREIEPALRRWAALAACVPDPTWAQLDSFRRAFGELKHSLPEPRYLQCMLDWLRDEKEDPISSDGRRLAISQTLVHRLLEDLRDAEGLPRGQLSTTERRARELIIQQLSAATPASTPMSDRRKMRLAFHRAVLEPARADDLHPFLGSAEAPELRRMLAAHIQRIHHPSLTAWRTLQDRLVEEAGGLVPLRHLARRHWWSRHDLLPLLVITATTGLPWATLFLDHTFGTQVAAGITALGFGGAFLVHQRRHLTVPNARAEKSHHGESDAEAHPKELPQPKGRVS